MGVLQNLTELKELPHLIKPHLAEGGLGAALRRLVGLDPGAGAAAPAVLQEDADRGWACSRVGGGC